eukprot:COSAG01_NODE_866_length_13045_cov_12.921288_7_plen_62_part_01
MLLLLSLSHTLGRWCNALNRMDFPRRLLSLRGCDMLGGTSNLGWTSPAGRQREVRRELGWQL